MINVERAAARLYEDSSLTDELTDEPAEMLLNWGAKQVKALAERIGEDEEQFENGVAALNRLVKTVNRFTWKRLDMDTEEQAKYVGRVVDAARQAGLDVQNEHLEQYLQQQDGLDETQNVKAMLEMVRPQTAPSHQEDTARPAPSAAPQENAPRFASSAASQSMSQENTARSAQSTEPQEDTARSDVSAPPRPNRQEDTRRDSPAPPRPDHSSMDNSSWLNRQQSAPDVQSTEDTSHVPTDETA